MKECESAEYVISDKREGRAKMGMPYASIAGRELNVVGWCQMHDVRSLDNVRSEKNTYLCFFVKRQIEQRCTDQEKRGGLPYQEVSEQKKTSPLPSNNDAEEMSFCND